MSDLDRTIEKGCLFFYITDMLFVPGICLKVKAVWKSSNKRQYAEPRMAIRRLN